MRKLLRRPAVLLVLALGLTGGAVTLIEHLASGPKSDLNRAIVAGEPGTNTWPAFSPDGRSIVYASRAETGDAVFHLFVRPVAAGKQAAAPRQITTAADSDISPAWSPDGRSIAFARLEERRVLYMAIPGAGGAERQVAAFANVRGESQLPPAVAWTRNDASLIVIDPGAEPPALEAVPVSGGGPVRLTNPPPDSAGDSTPAVSPDGTTLAFVRASATGGADIYTCDVHGGAPRRVTYDDRAIRGLAWTRDGSELVYATSRAGAGSQLFRISAAGGTPRLLPVAGEHANFPAIAPAGGRLAFVDNAAPVAIWRARLANTGVEGARELIPSTGRLSWPSYSPDGKRIAYISDQTGSDQIWMSDSEGANPRQVTRFGDWPRIAQPRWSPDGRSLLFFYAGTLGRGLFTQIQGRAQPKLIAIGGTNGSWSRDGKKVYFDADGRVWRASLDNPGPREAVTADFGTFQGSESPDGQYVYFRRRRSIWRVPAHGGKEEEVFTPEGPWSSLQPAASGLYYLGWEFGRRNADLMFYDLAARQSSALLPIRGSEMNASAYAISPDCQYVLYSQIDRGETKLMLLENFR